MEQIQSLEEHILSYHSPRNVKGYIRIINHFMAYIGQDKAPIAVYNDVVDYISFLRKGTMHPKTMMNQLYAVKMYYQWLADTGQRDDHPCRDLYLKDKIDRSIQIEGLYSKEEVQKIIEHQNSRLPLMRTRDKIIFSLLGNQAVTVTEIIHIKLEDIDLKKATLNLPGSSKTKARILPLKSDQIILINDYITKTRSLLLKNNSKPTDQDKQTLILSIRGNLMKPITITGLMKEPWVDGKKVTPQKIRQSVIANMLKEGKDLRVMQAFTGHRNIASVEEYRQTGLEELKTLVQKYHPLNNL
jgi:site-specific recombinase XerD